ncbi:hypothetical protein Tco_1299828 [Tanacetum coccineum]
MLDEKKICRVLRKEKSMEFRCRSCSENADKEGRSGREKKRLPQEERQKWRSRQLRVQEERGAKLSCVVA